MHDEFPPTAIAIFYSTLNNHFSLSFRKYQLTGPAELIIGVLDQAARSLALELAGEWAAYGVFCRRKLRVAPDRVLDACRYPGTEELMKTLKKYAQHKPVAHLVWTGLASCWKCRLCATALE